jgi:hypothetical protein
MLTYIFKLYVKYVIFCDESYSIQVKFEVFFVAKNYLTSRSSRDSQRLMNGVQMFL